MAQRERRFFKEVSGQGYVTNKVELVSLVCEDELIISCLPAGYREIAVKLFFDLTPVPPVKIPIFMFLLSRICYIFTRGCATHENITGGIHSMKFLIFHKKEIDLSSIYFFHNSSIPPLALDIKSFFNLKTTDVKSSLPM